MKKYKTAFLFLWFAAILFLMTASFTSLIFDEKRETVYNVTFVLDNDQNPRYDMLKKGIEQARAGTGVKLYYLNLSDHTDKEEIINLLSEQAEQKDMVIVKCDSTPLLQEAVRECNAGNKMICLNAQNPPNDICCNIYTDEQARGRALAQRIRQEQGDDCTVYVFGSAYGKPEQDAYINGLHEEKLKIVYCRERADEEIAERLEEISALEENSAVVGMRPEALKQIVRLEEEKKLEICVYGFGADSQILYDMEDGKIEAVNVVSDYHMGYAGVYSAWLALEGEKSAQSWELTDYTIGKEEMFLEEYANILFAGD